MTDVSDVKDAVEAVIDASNQPSDILFGLNVCLPVKSLADAFDVSTVRTLAQAQIVWTSPLYQQPAQYFCIFFEFEEVCRCLKVTLDEVTYKEENIGDRKPESEIGSEAGAS